MCMGGSAKAPLPPAPPEPPKEAPSSVDPGVQQARKDEKVAARAAAGRSGQIKTSSDLEAQDPNKANRTLLG